MHHDLKSQTNTAAAQTVHRRCLTPAGSSGGARILKQVGPAAGPKVV